MNTPLRGFTLIELLVVIAIISILSSVLLSSLRAARIRADDATVKDGLSSMRSAATDEYLDNNGTYLFDCGTTLNPNSASSNKIFKSVTKYAGGGYCQWGSSFYYVDLMLQGGGYFCVDSRGSATTSTPVVGQGHC